MYIGPGSVRFEVLSTLLAGSLALASSPALSQSAIGPGGGAMTPQPRVAPAAPQVPTMTPQAPVVAPQMPVATQPIPQPSNRSTTSSSNRDHIDQDAQTDIKKLRVINNSETDTATVEGQYSRTTGTPANPVASNSNTAPWHRRRSGFAASALDGSTLPLDYAERLSQIPLVAFAGQQDEVVPVASVASAVGALGATAKMIVLPDFDHRCCWARDWPRLRGQALEAQ